MKERFEGEDGDRRLIDTLLEQNFLRGNEGIAKEISSKGSLLELNQGESLIDQGDEDNDIYFILVGSLEVFVNERKVAERSSGNYIGEMAMIDHAAVRSATVKAKEKSVILSLREKHFSSIANDNPQLWRHLASELSSRLRQRGGRLKSPNQTPELFIGSTVEQLEVANTIQANLNHDDVLPVVWINGIFGVSQTPIESLSKQLERTDFAVLVIGNEDIVKSREGECNAPRDNIIFELGLFIGRVGKERVLMVKERGIEIKMPTDLLGVALLDYEVKNDNLVASLGHVCTEIKKTIKILGAL